jgi:hypothetical protein
MNDPGSLLSTLAQSTAVFVAIVGGFLVSRLVAISSERDGLRRRYKETRDQLKHVTNTNDFREAHAYRLRNSQNDFRRWVLDELVGVAAESVDREALLTDKIPRGSSRKEMAPYLEDLIERVKQVTDEITAQLERGDTSRLTLDDLEARGLVVRDTDRDIYLEVVDSIAEQLPRPQSQFGLMSDIRPLRIVNPVTTATELRRLDESIQAEQELHARMRILETEAERLRTEIALAGRPIGVTPAIIILAVYSLVGIVVPVVVLTLHPKTLAGWESWLLVVLFVSGLFAVLAYILWYARTLNNPVLADEDDRAAS